MTTADRIRLLIKAAQDGQRNARLSVEKRREMEVTIRRLEQQLREIEYEH